MPTKQALITAAEPLPFGNPVPAAPAVTPAVAPPSGATIQDIFIINFLQNQSREQAMQIKREELINTQLANQLGRPLRTIQSIEQPQLPVYPSYPTPQRTLTPATPIPKTPTPATSIPRSRSYSYLQDARPSSPVQGTDIAEYINWYISTQEPMKSKVREKFLDAIDKLEDEGYDLREIQLHKQHDD